MFLLRVEYFRNEFPAPNIRLNPLMTQRIFGPIRHKAGGPSAESAKNPTDESADQMDPPEKIGGRSAEFTIVFVRIDR
jgi:hypothetical protein